MHEGLQRRRDYQTSQTARGGQEGQTALSAWSSGSSTGQAHAQAQSAGSRKSRKGRKGLFAETERVKARSAPQAAAIGILQPQRGPPRLPLGSPLAPRPDSSSGAKKGGSL